MVKSVLVPGVIFAIAGLICTLIGLNTLTSVIVFAVLAGVYALILHFDGKTRRRLK